jgi:hypothetical protein
MHNPLPAKQRAVKSFRKETVAGGHGFIIILFVRFRSFFQRDGRAGAF